jgi:DMSO/TMAO reductase YedYZ heme-binding membrane subunit
MSSTQHSDGRRTVTILAVCIFLSTVGYTLLRYSYFKGVPLDHFPLYLLNKAVSWTAVLFIGWSFLIGILNAWNPQRFGLFLHQRRAIGLWGAGLALLHLLLSLPILNIAYFPKFYEANGKGEFCFGIELSMLTGALSLCVFLVVAVASLTSIKESLETNRWLKIQRWAYGAFFLALLHIIPIGMGNWFVPATWPGRMPPISLLTSLWIVLVISLRLATPYPKSSKNL